MNPAVGWLVFGGRRHLNPHVISLVCGLAVAASALPVFASIRAESQTEPRAGKVENIRQAAPRGALPMVSAFVYYIVGSSGQVSEVEARVAARGPATDVRHEVIVANTADVERSVRILRDEGVREFMQLGFSLEVIDLR
jgi:hypothetical protein